jgi:hypothetical protein
MHKYNDRQFKVLFLDVGLMQYACGLTQEVAALGRALVNQLGGGL